MIASLNQQRGNDMNSAYYWNSWYSGWGWFLWFGIVLLFISSIGNWSYTYRAHSKYKGISQNKIATDILDARLARGEISHEEHALIKSEIRDERASNMKKSA
jgi:putative membrane protein